ncbi:MAG: DUF2141 domain-containing protein [Rubripirellula sp.]
MSQEFTVDSDAPYQEPPTRWQENHGNLLMFFFAVTMLIGALILVYRQNRFVPVRFPDGDMIQPPSDELLDSTKANAKNSVTITIAGAANDTGDIKLAIFEDETSFNNSQDSSKLIKVRIVEGVGRLAIPHARLPKQFALAAFHDENGDSELNRNRWGIPSERFGFSKNERGVEGPPTFEQVVIDRPKAGQAITLFIR